MAKRKRRKSAGPPPPTTQRGARDLGAASKPAAPKRKPGEPVPPSFKGLLIRAGIVSAIFLLALIYIVGEDRPPPCS